MSTSVLQKALFLSMLTTAFAANAAVDVCYFGGPNLPNFKLNGNARLDGTSLVVTDPVGNQGSSLAYNAPLSTSGNISIQMKVKISANGNGGADGITFVMHNDPRGTAALGGLGDGIGYTGITKSVIVEFDTFTNSYFGDPNDNHVAVQKNGDANHNSANRIALVSNPGVTLKSGQPVWLWIEYTGSTRNLRVFLANTATRPASPIVNETVDVPAIVGPQMYLSFTGSTGGSWSKHEVMELLASDNGAAGASCCSSAADCAASTNGPVCDPVKRACGPCTLGDTSECGATQQACQVSSGVNACVAPCTGNLGAGGANPCTNAAFPVCSTSGASTGSCVACNADYGRPGQACPSGAPACLANGYCGRCTSNFDCAASASHAGNFCNVATGQCTTCSTNAQCGGSMLCVLGQCVCNADSDCGSNAFCAAGACQPKKPAGQAMPLLRTCPASAEAVCTTARCNDATNTCASGGGAPCTQPTQCSANICGADSRCGCVVDGDCEAAEHCAYASRTCVADLPAGSVIPNDGLHTGTCSDSASVCSTGSCNGVTGTCAQSTSAACTADSQCASNACKSNHCVPPANGCWDDVDCGASSWCDRATLSCKADLAAGQPLPNDGLHDGTCASGAAVCVGGLCNASSNTCALGDTADCSSNTECASNTCKSGHCVPSSSSSCWDDANCAASSYCERATLSCKADLAAGAPLPDGTCANAASICASGLCNAISKTCAASNTSSCSANAQCTSNSCKSGHCVVSGPGGCWDDSNCPSTSHCDQSQLRCVNDLAAGAPIPNDGAHGGTCSDAAAVCVSGQCNVTTVTCGGTTTDACASNNQCASNACKSGHCVPAGNDGCWADSDCSGNSYCDRWSYACKPKLQAGEGVPMDGLHGGTCSDAASVCSSGVCNATTNTCASSNTASCSSNAQCESNACKSGHCVVTGGCWSDTDCGASSHCNQNAMTCVADLAAGAPIPNDGAHDGTCANAATVCASGLCNASTNTCASANTSTCSSNAQCTSNSCKSGHCVVANSNSCWTDSDCGASSHCNQSAMTCVADLAAGAAIPNDGAHDGTCANASSVCTSGLCNPATNTCASSNTASCSSNAQCESNACKSGHCVVDGGCWSDADCGASSHCNQSAMACEADLAAGAPIPNDGAHDGTCANAASVCASGLCNAASNTCAVGATETCSSNAQCESNACKSGHCVTAGGCWSDSDCGASSHCNQNAMACEADLAPGAVIPNDGAHDGTCANAAAVCASGLCNAATHSCATAPASECSSAAQCTTNACVSGRCVAATSGCWLDSDCMGMGFCDRANLSCVADLPAGSPIPNDGLHDGTCGSFNASAVCLSGVCNAATNTCATDASTGCGAASECTSNTCTSGHCVPASNGCWLDSDCSAGSFCERTSMTCLAKMNAGALIPNDGLHDGTCADSSVCATGLCNETMNTCAVAASEVCANDAACVSNACVSGHCVAPMQGCWVDGDCGKGSYCDRENLTCAAKLSAGVTMPNDGLHDGTCSAASTVCASGACNAAMSTCAMPMQTRCAQNSECVSNVCASEHCVPAQNGCWDDANCGQGTHCDRNAMTCVANVGAGTRIPDDGLHNGVCATGVSTVCSSGVCNPATNTCAAANGTSCASASECRSNMCTSGVCVPNVGGCSVDADCGGEAWCDRDSLHCVARLTAGATLPVDALHDGTCATSANVCGSGICNATTNTCASAMGATCSGASQCESNACASNTCVPSSNGCAQNSDCSAGNACDMATFTCKAKPAVELEAAEHVVGFGGGGWSCSSTGGSSSMGLWVLGVFALALRSRRQRRE
ncbi:MAG: L-type lectin-domain containing protein [Archangium sp.]